MLGAWTPSVLVRGVGEIASAVAVLLRRQHWTVALHKEGLRTQVGKGWHYSLRGEDQLAYARMIRSASPANDRVVLANTGTEATLYAIRAARALSGRRKIALFDISCHGAHDTALVWPSPGSTPGRMEPITLGHGIPDSVVADVLLLP